MFERWSSTTRMRAAMARRRASEHYDAPRVRPRLQVGERLRRLFDGVAPGDHLLELEAAAEVERKHAREIDARHAGAEIAAGEGFFLEDEGHGAHRGRFAGARHADHHRLAAAADGAICDAGQLSRSDAL